MIEAVGYSRLSEKDQSHNSLSGQEHDIKDYCSRNGISLSRMFIENGKSAFTFDRPEWKNLEAYLRTNRNIKYLIVAHIDRFSRATLMDALIKLHEIEVKLKVKVLSVSDPINTDSKDLGVQLLRTINLLMSNNERNRIQERVKDGTYRSIANGRFCNMAPIGYLNSKDTDGKPLLLVDPEKSIYIQKVFSLYNSGMNVEAIRREVPELKLKGNSAIQYILSNIVYAGMLKVPAYKGKPAYEVKAIHQPIISKFDYYAAQNRLSSKTIVIQASEDVWLRGSLHCTCGRKMTAGNSKGRSRYYWYYKCPEHKINYRADHLHDKFKIILDELSYTPKTIEFFRKVLSNSIEDHLSKKGGSIMRLKLKLSKLQKQIEDTQIRFLSNPDIPAEVYSKAVNDLKQKEAELEISISRASTDSTTLTSILTELLPKLLNLSDTFFSFSLHQQQLFISTVFGNSLSFDGKIYRTAFIDPIFADKALILKEKGLLDIEQSFENSDELRFCTQPGSIIESYINIYNVCCG